MTDDIPERYRERCVPFKFGGRRMGVVTLAGEPLRIDTHQGIVWFEWHHHCGPMPINRKTGDGRELGPKHHFWRAVSLWDQQGKRIENGVAIYEHGKLDDEGQTVEELQAQGYVKVGRGWVPPDMYSRLAKQAEEKRVRRKALRSEPCPPASPSAASSGPPTSTPSVTATSRGSKEP